MGHQHKNNPLLLRPKSHQILDIEPRTPCYNTRQQLLDYIYWLLVLKTSVAHLAADTNKKSDKILIGGSNLAQGSIKNWLNVV